VPIDPRTWAIAEIIDRGAGVAASVASTPFDPFVTSKTGVRGAGFGLTIARAAAWADGGELALASADGVTVARMYLPVVSRDDTPV
jgi:nitrogen-specific signal transduction histidine kinase